MKTQQTTNTGAGSLESQVASSITDFFTQLTAKVGAISTPGPNPSPSPATAQKFQNYSAALQGLAQNNVSKSEGFSVEVKVSDLAAYHKKVEEILKRKQNRP